jgi:hypothetical protein
MLPAEQIDGDDKTKNDKDVILTHKFRTCKKILKISKNFGFHDVADLQKTVINRFLKNQHII